MYIVGGRILTMAGREIPEGILQIRNGKIAQVGARGEVKLQPEEGEQVVIAKNALIMPGIIEAHCHMGIMEEKKSTEGDDCNETATGGAAVSLAEGLSTVTGSEWEDLGMPETMWKFETNRLGPLVVAMDSKGNSLYEQVRNGLNREY